MLLFLAIINRVTRAHDAVSVSSKRDGLLHNWNFTNLIRLDADILDILHEVFPSLQEESVIPTSFEGSLHDTFESVQTELTLDSDIVKRRIVSQLHTKREGYTDIDGLQQPT